jgi:hypothetical protein
LDERKNGSREIHFASPSVMQIQSTGTIDVYQGEAAHFALELEAIAAFLRAALIANKSSN